jgi:hypothetical protein
MDAVREAQPKLVASAHSEVATDMIKFHELHRNEFTPADLAALRNWRQFAAVQMFSWGVCASSVAYMGARLAKPSGPLPTGSKVITVAGFLFGAASALPSTAPQLMHDLERLDTPLGRSVRESLARHSPTGAAARATASTAATAAPAEGQLAVPELTPFADRAPGVLNQWGDPVFGDTAASMSEDGSDAARADSE